MPMIEMWPVWASFLRRRHGFPAVNAWHFKIHQNYVGALGQCQLATLLTIIGRENLEVADALKAHLEHIEVVVVVFDAEHFGHDQPLFNQLFIRSPRRRGRAEKAPLGPARPVLGV
jgi:hypothetical protein